MGALLRAGIFASSSLLSFISLEGSAKEYSVSGTLVS